MRREESITLGRRLPNHALGEHSIADVGLREPEHVLSDLRLNSVEDLLHRLALVSYGGMWLHVAY